MITRRALLQLPFAALPVMALGYPPRCLIVFEGNSLSSLNNAVLPPTWTTLFMNGGVAKGYGLLGVNVAVAGDGVGQANNRAPIYVDPLRSTADMGICLFWEGTNSLGGNNFDADITFEQHRQYCAARKAAGWTTILGTIINRRIIYAGVEDDGRHETARLRFNQLVRDHASEFDAVFDIGADEILGADHAAWDTTYFRDGVHLTEAGSQRVANLADQVISQLMAHRIQFFPTVMI